MKKNKPVLVGKQTGSEKGTFRAGDPHPILDDTVFCHYKKRKSELYSECWLSVDQFRDRNEKNNERCRKRNVEFRENRLEVQARYREKNAEELRAKGREYQSKNKPRYAKNTANRRARMLNASTGLSDQDEKIISNFYIAAKRLSDCTRIKWDVDHIIPISRGGLHSPANLQLATHRWNQVKNNTNNDRVKIL